MVRYGDTVMIHDGSLLDGIIGFAYDVKAEQVLVLLEREVFWSVAPDKLQVIPADRSRGPAESCYQDAYL